MHAPEEPLTGSGPTAAPGAGPREPRRESRREGRFQGRIPLPRLTLRQGAVRPAALRPDALRPDAPRTVSATAPEPPVVSPDEDGAVDWRAVGLFGAGLALGALIGAGTALLMAPATGFETRTRIALAGRRAGRQAADRWEHLEDRARLAARQGKKRLARRLTMARWRAQDAWERKRYAE